MPRLEITRQGWNLLRSVAAGSDDFPQTTTNYNPVAAPATDRVVSRMLKKDGTALECIELRSKEDANELELRFRFDHNDHTCTWHMFAARHGSNDVKYVGKIAATAGTQAAADGTFFATTAVFTDYWSVDPVVSGAESGTGMVTVRVKTDGYDRFWLASTTTNGVSAGTAYVDYSWV